MNGEFAKLGEGLGRLIQQVGSALTRTQDITTVPVNDPQRRTYRLWFEDGQQLKGRYYVSSRFAEVSRRIRDGTALEFLPRVVAREGDAMLEEWIEGEIPGAGDVEEALFRECGRMQGRLHQCPPPPLADLGFKSLEISDWAGMLTASLAKLVDGGVLSEAVARRVEESAFSHLPARQRTGIVNRDLCPENIVLSADGRLHLVDNGSLTIGSIDEDLCRTWYRWPMTAAQRGVFASGYREFGDPAGFENPSMFWRVMVIVNSASFRLKSSPAAATTVLEKLQDLMTMRNES